MPRKRISRCYVLNRKSACEEKEPLCQWIPMGQTTRRRKRSHCRASYGNKYKTFFMKDLKRWSIQNPRLHEDDKKKEDAEDSNQSKLPNYVQHVEFNDDYDKDHIKDFEDLNQINLSQQTLMNQNRKDFETFYNTNIAGREYSYGKNGLRKGHYPRFNRTQKQKLINGNVNANVHTMAERYGENKSAPYRGILRWRYENQLGYKMPLRHNDLDFTNGLNRAQSQAFEDIRLKIQAKASKEDIQNIYLHKVIPLEVAKLRGLHIPAAYGNRFRIYFGKKDALEDPKYLLINRLYRQIYRLYGFYYLINAPSVGNGNVLKADIQKSEKMIHDLEKELQTMSRKGNDVHHDKDDDDEDDDDDDDDEDDDDDDDDEDDEDDDDDQNESDQTGGGENDDDDEDDDDDDDEDDDDDDDDEDSLYNDEDDNVGANFGIDLHQSLVILRAYRSEEQTKENIQTLKSYGKNFPDEIFAAATAAKKLTTAYVKDLIDAEVQHLQKIYHVQALILLPNDKKHSANISTQLQTLHRELQALYKTNRHAAIKKKKTQIRNKNKVLTFCSYYDRVKKGTTQQRGGAGDSQEKEEEDEDDDDDDEEEEEEDSTSAAYIPPPSKRSMKRSDEEKEILRRKFPRLSQEQVTIPLNTGNVEYYIGDKDEVNPKTAPYDFHENPNVDYRKNIFAPRAELRKEFLRTTILQEQSEFERELRERRKRVQIVQEKSKRGEIPEVVAKIDKATRHLNDMMMNKDIADIYETNEIANANSLRKDKPIEEYLKQKEDKILAAAKTKLANINAQMKDRDDIIKQLDTDIRKCDSHVKAAIKRAIKTEKTQLSTFAALQHSKTFSTRRQQKRSGLLLSQKKRGPKPKFTHQKPAEDEKLKELEDQLSKIITYARKKLQLETKSIFDSRNDSPTGLDPDLRSLLTIIDKEIHDIQLFFQDFITFKKTNGQKMMKLVPSINKKLIDIESDINSDLYFGGMFDLLEQDIIEYAQCLENMKQSDRDACASIASNGLNMNTRVSGFDIIFDRMQRVDPRKALEIWKKSVKDPLVFNITANVIDIVSKNYGSLCQSDFGQEESLLSDILSRLHTLHSQFNAKGKGIRKETLSIGDISPTTQFEDKFEYSVLNGRKVKLDGPAVLKEKIDNRTDVLKRYDDKKQSLKAAIDDLDTKISKIVSDGTLKRIRKIENAQDIYGQKVSYIKDFVSNEAEMESIRNHIEKLRQLDTSLSSKDIIAIVTTLQKEVDRDDSVRRKRGYKDELSVIKKKEDSDFLAKLKSVSPDTSSIKFVSMHKQPTSTINTHSTSTTNTHSTSTTIDTHPNYQKKINSYREGQALGDTSGLGLGNLLNRGKDTGMSSKDDKDDKHDKHDKHDKDGGVSSKDDKDDKDDKHDKDGGMSSKDDDDGIGDVGQPRKARIPLQRTVFLNDYWDEDIFS